MSFPGNDNLHAITARKKYALSVELADFEGQVRFAEYADFAVANEDNKYRLTVRHYSGTAGDYDAYFKIIFLILQLASLSMRKEYHLCKLNQACNFALRKGSVVVGGAGRGGRGGAMHGTAG